MKNVLITGAKSYIGDSVAEYLRAFPCEYSVTIKDTVNWIPEPSDFNDIDVVFNVAGIVHIKETDENRDLYYKVNRDLSIAIAKVANEAGVRQFILLSTMSVYGMTVGHITKDTRPNPVNSYGRSKLEADREINRLSKESDGKFKFCCLRPPMVYGKGCKGNYQSLRKFALKSPVFPDYKNQRSMLYIGNLCWFIKDCIDRERHGLFFPQNVEYVRTSDMVKLIAKENGKTLFLTKIFNGSIKAIGRANVIKKVFGSLTYDKKDIINKYDFRDSVAMTEGKIKTIVVLSNEHSWTYNLRKEIIQALIDKEYRVVLVLPYGEKVELLKEMGCEFIDIPMFQRRGKNPITELRLILEYRRILKNIKPDMVLTYTIKPNLYGGFVCGIQGIPFIANITGLGSAVNDKGIVPYLTMLLYRIGLKKATCVFAQNESSKKYLVDNRILDSSRVKRISGSGVNLDRFTVLPYPSDDVIRFAFISRILKEKGIDQYIEAASEIRKKYPNTEFHVCGLCEDDYKGNLDAKNADGTVIYHGMIDNVANFLENIHCLVHPSYYLEGLSNVCLEAAASGRPVITTDHEGCRETVINMKTGFIVPVKDTRSLIEVINHFIIMTNDERKAMGIEARRYVEENFDRRIIVKAYMENI